MKIHVTVDEASEYHFSATPSRYSEQREIPVALIRRYQAAQKRLRLIGAQINAIQRD